ncbi:glutaminyl-tRNA synthetase [Pisolithus sp. B1]|nr:glutaminyl-tRNA synthetase [Pisolithus sp. B1]
MTPRETTRVSVPSIPAISISMTSPSSEDLVSLFKSAGLPQSKAAEATKNAKGAAILHLVSAGLSEKQAVLVSSLSLQLGKAQNIGGEERAYIVNAILEEKLKSVDQVNVAVKYFETHTVPVDENDFNATCGVGFAITTAQLEDHIKQYMVANNASNWSHLGANVPALRWANPLDIKNAVERVFTEKFGPKEGAKPKPKKETASAADASVTSKPPVAKARRIIFEEGFLGSLHKPGDNPQIHPRLRERHLAATGGQVYTRFPPEPNGYLHIGHCKAIFVNFGYAAHHGGNCYLRFDDTNPEKEEGRYFDSIIEVIYWLGFEPWKITYSSDYFDELYTLAEDLIRRDKAYVCHCSQEQIKADRGEKVSSPKACLHRTRPVEESLTEFRSMRDGHYRPKEAFLRMKQDLSDGNPQMWDLPAYRVLDAPHHRTGPKWKIYPTYDFTHCLVDSFENISHSLCTTEFIASRQSYEWLCDALEVYKPKQSEYGRLNIQGTINSKRKLLQLVEEKYVSGWDDPRLYTVIALRRRGVPPEAILNFVSSLGVSTAASNIQIVRFEQSVRQYLEGSVPRLLMVLRPLKVTIENLPEDYSLELPLSHFTRTIYIDADDFRLEDSKDYFRLAPGKTVGLFQAPHPITCTSYVKDASTGQVTEVICRLEDRDARKPKAFIQWVAEHAPSGSPVRPDINSKSMEVIRGAMVEIGFWSLARKSMGKALEESRSRIEKMRSPAVTSERLVGKECIRFQAPAAGATQGDYLVLNRIVSLKEDIGKGAS